MKKAGRSLADQFWQFTQTVRIPSRDAGMIPFRPWSTQLYVLTEILAALADGIHDIIILKPRQIGVTTVLLLLDLFWMLRFRQSGMTGAFITEDEKNTEYFRDMLVEFYGLLPPRYSWPLAVRNKGLLKWVNGSRLVFQTAGLRSAKKLGRSKGLNFLHGSEVAYWEQAASLPDFFAALSQRHPQRLFIRESTANGFNHYSDMWQQAHHHVSERPIFVGWWRHSLYELDPAADAEQAKLHRVYWDGKPTGDERAWSDQIQRRWGVTVRPTQWAWFRATFAESQKEDWTKMHQNFPTLPEHAFQASGSPWLGAQTMNLVRKSVAEAPEPEYWRYLFGSVAEASTIHQTSEQLAQVTTWEQPQENTYYVVSADPAFGASADSDYHTAQVWRVERGRLIQVAEYHDNAATLQQFAWVCMQLAGAYSRAFFILELQGPGHAVMQEIERMRSIGWGTARRAEWGNVIGSIQNYIYRRPDTFGSAPAWHFMTTGDRRDKILMRLRDVLMVGTAVVRSQQLVEELADMRRMEGGHVESEGKHDDTVLAAALAVECWLEQAAPMVQYLPQPVEAPALVEAPPVQQRLMQDFFRGIGVS